MLNILLMIILLIIIIIFIILLFGIRLTARWMKVDNEYDGCIEVLIFKKLKVYTFNLNSDDEDDDDESEEEDEERDLKKLFELAKPCFKYLKVFFYEFLDATSINRLENDLVIGFSSFAKTGEYIGYIWAILSALMGMIPNAHLRAHPSFAGEVLNIKGYMNIDISLLKLIMPLVKLISKKEIRTLIRGVLNG